MRRWSIENFSLGKAPFFLALLAVITGVLVFTRESRREKNQPDLHFALFNREQRDTYLPVIQAVEKERSLRIGVELVAINALQSRLRSAMLANAPVPDVVEMVEGSMGFFCNGPLEDVGFQDLTDWIRRDGLDTALAHSRFSLWSTRGRIFALPNDVHPVMLAYRRDIVDSLGIDVSKMVTWDDFAAVARDRIVADLNGDKVPDRYALDMPNGAWALDILMLQQDISIFDEHGRVGFDNEETLRTILWMVRANDGPGQFARSCGWGQNFSRSMIDGIVLFYFTPDWRSMIYERDVPSLRGKMALMPLPVWAPGGRRTSTWGGSGLAITKAARNKEAAWALAKRMYFDSTRFAARWRTTHILPALRSAWSIRELDEPSEFYSGQPIGRMYAELAPEVPAVNATPFLQAGKAELWGTFDKIAQYYKNYGDGGLEEFARDQLRQARLKVERVMARNAFHAQTVSVKASLREGRE